MKSAVYVYADKQAEQLQKDRLVYCESTLK